MSVKGSNVFQRLDELLSAPMFKLKLPDAVERILAFPDGECFFGKNTAMTNCWVAMSLAQLLCGESVMAAGLACTMSSYLAVIAGKHSVARRRPEPELVGLAERSPTAAKARSQFAPSEKWMNTSFPSGGGCISMGYGGFFALYFKNPWFYLLPAVTSFCRVYFCCHWFGDTVVGMAMGYGIIKYIEKLGGPAGLHGIGFDSPVFLVPTILMSTLATLKWLKERKMAAKDRGP